jgi:hypothetical protein
MKQELDKSGPFFAVGGLAVAFFLYAYSAIALPGWLNSLVLPLFWRRGVVRCDAARAARLTAGAG